MSLFEHHIFVCLNERDVADPRGCCKARGSESLIETFRIQVKEAGLKATVRVNKAGCLDQCSFGPTIVIYPEAVWYAHVSAADVPEILTAMRSGRVVDRLLHPKLKPDPKAKDDVRF